MDHVHKKLLISNCASWLRTSFSLHRIIHKTPLLYAWRAEGVIYPQNAEQRYNAAHFADQ